LAGDLPGSSFDRAPVGTGPFEVVGFDPAHNLLQLRANTVYFRQQPHLASLTFRYYKDSDALLSALSAGEIQGTGSLPVTTVLRPGALPNGLTAYAPLLAGYTALYFNLRVTPFTSVDVRRAIDLAVDRQGLTKDVLPDQAVPGDGPIPVSSWAYSAQPHQPDVSAARELLNAAGWSDTDGDGVLDKGSSSLSFPLLVNGDDPQRLALATEISRQLAAIKIQAQVQPVSSGDVAQALMSHQFTAAIFGWESPTGDPDCYQSWHSSQSDTGLNFSGLNDPKIDQLLANARTAGGNDRRAALYAQFQQAFAQDVPALILYYPRYFFVVSNKVQGITVQPVIDPSQRLADVSSWFMVGVPLMPVSTPESSPAA
jgi:peptide/nickel transport system substrate-binding protein